MELIDLETSEFDHVSELQFHRGIWFSLCVIVWAGLPCEFRALRRMWLGHTDSEDFCWERLQIVVEPERLLPQPSHSSPFMYTDLHFLSKLFTKEGSNFLVRYSGPSVISSTTLLVSLSLSGHVSEMPVNPKSFLKHLSCFVFDHAFSFFVKSPSDPFLPIKILLIVLSLDAPLQ